MTDLAELRSLNLDWAKRTTQIAQLQANQAEIVQSLAEVVRQAEEERRQFEKERRQVEEDNRQAHQRFDLLHQEIDERFSALIKMMDEWIRERRNNGRPPDPAPG